MSIKFYVLGGLRYKPLGVSRGSPRLHFIIMFMLMFVCCCCCDRNKVQFNSIHVHIYTYTYRTKAVSLCEHVSFHTEFRLDTVGIMSLCAQVTQVLKHQLL